jgi:1-acyl-sn-glycerol-3-phosphate acyltransferase
VPAPSGPVASVPAQSDRAPRHGVAGPVADRAEPFTVAGPDEKFLSCSRPLLDLLHDRYFRVEGGGWERLPAATSLLVGVHAGATLTMDAWMLVYAWWRRFGAERILHGTAHDVLMALPGLGTLFRRAGVIPASRRGVAAALAAGHDVVVWPGGEKDSMRAWTRRDQVELAGRSGFVRQAIRSGVPIVPVATVGGSDTAPVLLEGGWLARRLGGKRLLRAEMCPVVLGPPFGVAVEILPIHLPLPAKIRFELLDPIDVGDDPDRVHDADHVQRLYTEVERCLQAGVTRLARRRRFPLFG